MIESLNAIRSLGLAPVFEGFYFGSEVPANVAIYMRYPDMFRNVALAQCEPLTGGGLIQSSLTATATPFASLSHGGAHSW